MIIKSSLTFIVLTLNHSAQPPVPKMGVAPPVGDVPLDNFILLLVFAALIIGTVVILRNGRAQQS
jgi:hypothetical protein